MRAPALRRRGAGPAPVGERPAARRGHCAVRARFVRMESRSVTTQAWDAARSTVPTGTRAESYGGGRRTSGARPMRRCVTARRGRKGASFTKAAQRWRRSRPFAMLPRGAGSCGLERAICLHSADTAAIAYPAKRLQVIESIGAGERTRTADLLITKLEASHDDPRPGQAGPKTQPALGECPPNPETSPSRAAGFSASQERHRDRNNHER